jgi:outer membrane protein assembly factor BamB
MITRAYDLLSGTLQWEDRFDQYGNDDYGSGLATAGNRLLVTGLGGAPNENESAAVVRAFDSKTGALLWEDLTLDPGFS